jgi:hypothetical protein
MDTNIGTYIWFKAISAGLCGLKKGNEKLCNRPITEVERKYRRTYRLFRHSLLPAIKIDETGKAGRVYPMSFRPNLMLQFAN